MVNIKRRFYIGAMVILVLGLLASAIWVWQLWTKDHRHQDKVYSGAKLVSGRIPNNLLSTGDNGGR